MAVVADHCHQRHREPLQSRIQHTIPVIKRGVITHTMVYPGEARASLDEEEGGRMRKRNVGSRWIPARVGKYACDT